jgi:hypothetical protein
MADHHNASIYESDGSEGAGSLSGHIKGKGSRDLVINHY